MCTCIYHCVLLQIGDLYALESNVYGLSELFWCINRPFTPKQVNSNAAIHKVLIYSV